MPDAVYIYGTNSRLLWETKTGGAPVIIKEGGKDDEDRDHAKAGRPGRVDPAGRHRFDVPDDGHLRVLASKEIHGKDKKRKRT
jgi:hypothetical protein